MKLFLHYLRSKALKIGAFLLFALLFLFSFRLYHLPLAAVWYPSALCAALGLVTLLLDFRRVRQRHLELQQILKNLPTLPETLPQPQAVLEEDYRALTRALLAQQRTLETQLNSRYQDMLDYYTLWAHQIKTPIASMRLSLQQEDTPKARQLLQAVNLTGTPFSPHCGLMYPQDAAKAVSSFLLLSFSIGPMETLPVTHRASGGARLRRIPATAAL